MSTVNTQRQQQKVNLDVSHKVMDDEIGDKTIAPEITTPATFRLHLS
jgi:hypothetical protein